jgi:hypothetical protein|tara:strand:+ start:666 stop:1505 length:840 start_codon:yes stop_codon:yes gene_type:complete
MHNSITGVPIYRFEPADCDRIDSLRDGRLYIADPANFNDPLDLRIEIKDLTNRAGFSENGLREAVSKLFHSVKVDQAHRLFNEELLQQITRWSRGDTLVSLNDIVNCLEHHIANFGVQCFSSNFEIPLSWSHYASGHQGFCIEYDLRKMTLAGGNDLAMYDVTYTNELPEVCVSEVLFTPHQAISRLLATKTIDWAYEQEFRLVNFENKGCKVDMPAGLRINSLIAGANISRPHRDLLCSVGKQLGVCVYQMARNDRPKQGQLWNKELVYTPAKEMVGD